MRRTRRATRSPPSRRRPPGARAMTRCVGLLAMFAAAGAAAAAGGGPVRVELVEYGGWKNNLKIGNGTVELIVTLDVGPRVISYKPAAGANVFHEAANELGKSGEPKWVARGGHRLWTAPEDLTRTYAPDNGP